MIFSFFVHDVLPLILKNLEKFTALLVDDVELYRLVLYRMTSQSIKLTEDMMNHIINFVLKNKFAVWLMTIIVTVAGLYAGMNMKQESIPDVNMPYLSVNTTYPGAAPSQVADDVTKPIEQAVQNLEGVSVVTSTSSENVSSVMIEYDYNKDMDKAKTEVAEALDSVSLPDDAKNLTFPVTVSTLSRF